MKLRAVGTTPCTATGELPDFGFGRFRVMPRRDRAGLQLDTTESASFSALIVLPWEMRSNGLTGQSSNARSGCSGSTVST